MQSGYRGDELPLTINLIPILCLRENVNQKGGALILFVSRKVCSTSVSKYILVEILK